MSVIRALVSAAGLALLLPGAAGAATADQTLPSIVARSIEYHGGELFRSSTVDLRQCSKSGCYRMEVTRDGGVFRYDVASEIRDPSRRVVWTNDDLRLWIDGEEREVPADETARWESWVSARVYFPFLPFRLADPGVVFDDRGIRDWDGKRLHEVAVEFQGGGDAYRHWFDPATGRLVQFAYAYSSGIRFRLLVDCRRVDGLLFCDQENLGVDAEGLSVELVTPEYVAEEMEQVSTVRLEDVRVDPL